MDQGVELILQGRRINASEIDLVKKPILSNPSWNRTRISKELCLIWGWRRASGEVKNIACRSLLRKLELLGFIKLPKGVHKNDSPARRKCVQRVLHSTTPIRRLSADWQAKYHHPVFLAETFVEKSRFR